MIPNREKLIMKREDSRLISLTVYPFFLVFIFFTSCDRGTEDSPEPPPSRNYDTILIDESPGKPEPDGVELGIGRNDGTVRVYTTLDYSGDTAWEYSCFGGLWSSEETLTAPDYCSAPTIAALGSLADNSLYLGGWDYLGVLYTKYNGSGWPSSSGISGSDSNSWVLAMKAGNGRNDGITRLYVCGDRLTEYSWNGSGYDSEEVAGYLAGRIGIGDGRNDGVSRIYAVRRGTDQVHEYTWDTGSSGFTDTIIWNGDSSEGSAFVGDGRGDGVQRVYVWAGGLYELTFSGGNWSFLEMDSRTYQRFYINVGSIGDNSPGVYVSTKNQGLFEYVWSPGRGEYTVDTISAATGGTAIGDGRNDGVRRLYAARGTKNHFTDAAIVEISDGD
jgi:hypothetical protein